MATWIRADYTFGLPCKTFTVTLKQAIENGLIDRLDAVTKECPTDELCEHLTGWIEVNRPDLAGCILYSIGYSIDRQRFYLLLSHRSLPTSKPYEQVPSEPLIREESQSEKSGLESAKPK